MIAGASLFQCDTVALVMGQFTSSHRKENRNTTTSSVSENDTAPIVRSRHEHFLNKYAELMKRKGLLPEIFLVHQTPSSQYVDEDGDVAHEFYAEHQSQDGQMRRLQRVVNNLRPKGYERYAIPRLSPDVPVVMWEMEQQ
nr:tumor suppressor candidate 2 [Haemonchus contortus]